MSAPTLPQLSNTSYAVRIHLIGHGQAHAVKVKYAFLRRQQAARAVTTIPFTTQLYADHVIPPLVLTICF